MNILRMMYYSVMTQGNSGKEFELQETRGS